MRVDSVAERDARESRVLGKEVRLVGNTVKVLVWCGAEAEHAEFAGQAGPTVPAAPIGTALFGFALRLAAEAVKAEAETEAEPAPKPKTTRKRRTTKKADVEVKVEAEATDEAKGEEEVAEKPKRAPRKRAPAKKKAEPVVETPASVATEPALEPQPEPVMVDAQPETEVKPKKKGWWSLGS